MGWWYVCVYMVMYEYKQLGPIMDGYLHLLPGYAACVTPDPGGINDIGIKGLGTNQEQKSLLKQCQLFGLDVLKPYVTCWDLWTKRLSGIILYMHPANERWHYSEMWSLTGWGHIQNDSWTVGPMSFTKPLDMWTRMSCLLPQILWYLCHQSNFGCRVD